jgi:hypothetical protein
MARMRAARSLYTEGRSNLRRCPLPQLEFNTDIDDMPCGVPVLVKQMGNPCPFMGLRDDWTTEGDVVRMKLEPLASDGVIPVSKVEGWFPLLEAFGLVEAWNKFPA